MFICWTSSSGNAVVILHERNFTEIHAQLRAFCMCQVYDGLSYKLVLEFPSGYPYKAPTVKFETPCYHPNVDGSGNICLDILKEKWSALYDVRTILLSVQSLLAGDCLTVFG